MKKGYAIGLIALVIVAGLVGYMATHKPPQPQSVSETAEMLADAVPAATPAPAPAPAPVGETAVAETATVQTAPATFDLSYAAEDRAVGNPDAPVVMIEYASLTCPHCAHFSNHILPEFKKKLVDTGKVYLIYRDFPLDRTALAAAKLTRCAPKEKYFDFLDVIFKNQSRWTSARDPIQILRQYGTLIGMTEDYMQQCLDSVELENHILHRQSEAQDRYFVRSTPTFVLNFGEKIINGAQEVAQFQKEIELLSQKKEQE